MAKKNEAAAKEAEAAKKDKESKAKKEQAATPAKKDTETKKPSRGRNKPVTTAPGDDKKEDENHVKVRMARNVLHNDVSYKAGEDVILTKKDAELFAEKGFIEGDGTPAKAEPAKPEEPATDEGYAQKQKNRKAPKRPY